MNTFAQNTFTDLQLAILAAVLLPALLAALIWFGVTLHTIARRLHPFTHLFRLSADHLSAQETSDRNNLNTLASFWKARETSGDRTFPKTFLTARTALMDQADRFYLGDFLPSAKHYFSIHKLLNEESSPSHSSTRRNLTLLVLAVVMSCESIAASFFSAMMPFPVVIILGMIASACLAAVKFLLDLFHWISWQNLIRQHQRFCSEFDRAIPVLDSQSAATFEAARTISDQISGFATKLVTPALDAALERIATQQEQAMAHLAKDFTHQLTHTVEERMIKFSERIGSLQGELKNLNHVIAQNVHGIDNMISAQRKVLDEAAQKMVAAGVDHARIFSKAAESQTQLIQQASSLSQEQHAQMIQFTTAVDQLSGQNTTFSQLANQLIQQTVAIKQAVSGVDQTFDGFTVKMNQAMAAAGKEIAQGIQDNIGDSHDAIEKLTQQANQLREDYQHYFGRLETQSQSTFQAMDQHVQNSFSSIETHLASLLERNRQETEETFQEANRAQQELAGRLHSSQESIDQAVQRVTRLFDGITDRMNHAMSTAGREIAQGIREVTADNADAIGKLTEQGQMLRDDYDRYFSNLETHSRNTFEEMDYHVQNIIAKVTEEVTALLERQSVDHQTVLTAYKDGTLNLLTTFEEQANSINLYAKEINLDIGELSSNLKDSVTSFSTGMQETVSKTLEEFDQGLAELSLRIANTVDNIRDAVEELPQALRKN